MSIKSIISSTLNRYRKSKLTECGKNVFLSKGHYCGNLYFGSNISVNSGAWFVASKAKITIMDNVVFAPNVTIYAGGHATDILGYHISDIDEELKKKSSKVNDKDVVIESGCWIGTRAIILKGVTIGRGSVIGAGAIVTKDIPPYSIYVGVPDSRTYARFAHETVEKHERMLIEKGKVPCSYTPIK